MVVERGVEFNFAGLLVEFGPLRETGTARELSSLRQRLTCHSCQCWQHRGGTTLHAQRVVRGGVSIGDVDGFSLVVLVVDAVVGVHDIARAIRVGDLDLDEVAARLGIVAGVQDYATILVYRHTWFVLDECERGALRQRAGLLDRKVHLGVVRGRRIEVACSRVLRGVLIRVLRRGNGKGHRSLILRAIGIGHADNAGVLAGSGVVFRIHSDSARGGVDGQPLRCGSSACGSKRLAIAGKCQGERSSLRGLNWRCRGGKLRSNAGRSQLVCLSSRIRHLVGFAVCTSGFRVPLGLIPDGVGGAHSRGCGVLGARVGITLLRGVLRARRVGVGGILRVRRVGACHL